MIHIKRVFRNKTTHSLLYGGVSDSVLDKRKAVIYTSVKRIKQTMYTKQRQIAPGVCLVK